MNLDANIPASTDVPADGMDEVLACRATQRFTGLLSVSDAVGEVSLPLRAGVVDIDLDPALPEVAARVLSARVGRYTLTEEDRDSNAVRPSSTARAPAFPSERPPRSYQIPLHAK